MLNFVIISITLKDLYLFCYNKIEGDYTMKISDVELSNVAVRRSQYPIDGKPEFLLIGRSNVGKSSFTNSIMERKNFARISGKPGKTQTINFYKVNREMYLVDLPGYGYARVSQSEKEKWGKMIERYLHTSRNLKAVFLLIDIRHAPSANDCQMYEWILHNGFRPIIIATKLDKLKRSQVQKNLKILREGLRLEKDVTVIPFSAETKQGREEIWELIDRFTDPDSGEEA